MRSSDDIFKQNLDTGCEFERSIVEPLLLEHFPNHWIISYHDNRIEAHGGPRIKAHGERDLILPDFGAISKKNPSDRMLFEAKYKSSAFSVTGYYGQLFVAIEEYKCLQYQEVARIMCADLLYVIGCEQTNGIYLYQQDDAINYSFNNKFGRGPVQMFKIDDEHKLGELK